MLKKMLALLLTLCLLPIVVVAEDSAVPVLSAEELTAWVQGYRTRAEKEQPLNDPKSSDALTEDGYAFVYEFATLYMDRPEMTADSVLRAIVLTTEEGTDPRGLGVDVFTQDVLNAYYNENPELEGTYQSATLYVSNQLPSEACWAGVYRDGQQISLIQYAVYEQLAAGDEGYRDMGLLYTIQGGLVTAIRAYGLDSSVTAASVQVDLDNAADIQTETGYHRVPFSYNGLELDPLTEADLLFSGIDYLTATPDTLTSVLGPSVNEEWIKDDDNYLHVVDFESCIATFLCNSKKEDPRLTMLTIDTPALEGPRCVRVGDSLSDVRNRFRNSEGNLDESTGVETLYRHDNGWGEAEYNIDNTSVVRYGATLSSGSEIILYMTFDQMLLTEILLFVND